MQTYTFLYSTVTFTIFDFTFELLSCWCQGDGHISALYARLKCQKHPAQRTIQRKDAAKKIWQVLDEDQTNCQDHPAFSSIGATLFVQIWANWV